MLKEGNKRNLGEVLITGSNGFIGSSVSRLFVERLKHSITLTSRSHTPKISGNIRFIKADLTDKESLRCFPGQIDTVIHLSGIPSLRKKLFGGKSSVNRLFKINTEAVENLANWAVESGVDRLVFLSSVKVHGEYNWSGQPFSESDQFNPQSVYAESKALAELRLAEICKNTPLELVVVRPPSVYGSEVRGNMKILLKLAAAGFPLPIGGISAPRSIVSLKNLSDFILCCATNIDAKGHSFFVSDGGSLTLQQIIDSASVVGERKYSPRVVDIPPDILRRAARLLAISSKLEPFLNPNEVSIEKARTVLKWEPASAQEDVCTHSAAASK